MTAALNIRNAKAFGAQCPYKDADDGCCTHSENMTPECHKHVCPLPAPITKLQRVAALAATGDKWAVYEFAKAVARRQGLNTARYGEDGYDRTIQEIKGALNI